MQWKALNVKSNWKVKAHSWLQHEVMVMFRVSLSRFKHHWVSNSFYSSIKLEFYFYSSCHNSIKRTSKKSWNTSQKLSATIKEMYSLARLAMRHSENILSLCPLRGQLLVQPKKNPQVLLLHLHSLEILPDNLLVHICCFTMDLKACQTATFKGDILKTFLSPCFDSLMLLE